MTALRGKTSGGHWVDIQVDSDGKLALAADVVLEADLDTMEGSLGATNETVAASDTATGGLNALLKRLLQHLTTLHGLVQRSATTGRLLSAANTTNATAVKGSAGVLYKIEGWNAATVSYLKIYNKATAPDENDTPRMTIYLPASLKFDIDFGPNGLTFATGIGYRLTTAGADNDTGAVAAAAVLAMNVHYT